MAIMVGLAFALAGAVAVIFRGRVTTGIWLLILAMAGGHVAIVWTIGQNAVIPRFACVPVLVAAATLRPRWISAVIACALLTIATEAWVVSWSESSWPLLAAPVWGGVLLVITAGVISVLHVRGMERALGVAQERDALRQQAADEARESEERYRLIADNSSDMISLLDDRGHAVYLSPSHCRWLGSGALRLDSAALAALHPNDRADLGAAFRRALEQGHATALSRLVTEEGSHRTFESELSRVTREGKNFVAIISRDVTERRSLEDQLRKAQRMEALGRLAGGVAHDFNNLLGVIAGATELALDSLHVPASLGKTSVASVWPRSRAAALTRQLLTFSRKRVVTAEALDPAETVRGLYELMQRLVGARVITELELGPDCPSVNLPRAQVEQILMNFAANARDAMPDGGRLRVAVTRRELEAGDVPELARGTYVEVAATDTGTGMAPEAMAHLFEPFFTTKSDTRGTGLGLATCYGIAKQCGGTIQADSHPGLGTTFRALLPACDGSRRDHGGLVST
jgi:PAS domain S-box-containing protein